MTGQRLYHLVIIKRYRFIISTGGKGGVKRPGFTNCIPNVKSESLRAATTRQVAFARTRENCSIVDRRAAA